MTNTEGIIVKCIAGCLAAAQVVILLFVLVKKNPLSKPEKFPRINLFAVISCICLSISAIIFAHDLEGSTSPVIIWHVRIIVTGMALSLSITIPVLTLCSSFVYATNSAKSKSMMWARATNNTLNVAKPSLASLSSRNSTTSYTQRKPVSIPLSNFSATENKKIEQITLFASSTCSWTVVLVLVFMFIFYPMKCSITQTPPEYDEASDVFVQPYANICQSENQIYWFLALALAHCALAAFGLLVAWTMKQSKLHRYLSTFAIYTMLLVSILTILLACILILLLFSNPAKQQLIVSCFNIVISFLSSVLFIYAMIGRF